MTDLQRAYLDRAERALASARLNVDAGDGEAATNRAYYACFYVVQAALVGEGEAPKTHSGTHRRFAVLFVATGAVSRDIGRILPDAFRLRLQSDYDAFAVTDTAAAADLLADAERFVAVVRELVDGSEEGG
ncbi:HEPN domain-containing protein [Rubrivirga sp.]|uniref:HEPN domain-containing protein n=1 Tax=Rubrivirga sp. TaxID=1885344 RepID=UPI003B529E4E